MTEASRCRAYRRGGERTTGGSKVTYGHNEGSACPGMIIRVKHRKYHTLAPRQKRVEAIQTEPTVARGGNTGYIE